MANPTGRHPVKTTSGAASALTATGNGTGQDMRGCAELVAILNVLAASGTTPNMAAKLQLAPTLTGTYVDIPGAAFTAVTSAPNRQTLKVTGDNADGFVRVAYTITGTSPSFTTAVDLVGLGLHDTVLAEGI